jgi:hypothetical protein
MDDRNRFAPATENQPMNFLYGGEGEQLKFSYSPGYLADYTQTTDGYGL